METQSPPSPDLQLLSRAIAASVNSVIISDAQHPDMPIIFVNPAFERLSGYTAAEIIGRNCRFLQGHDRDQDARHEIRHALAQGQEITTLLRNYRKDGTLFYNELTISPIWDAAGVLTHFVSFQNDVTAREEAKQQKARANQHLTSILERMTDGFVSFDPRLERHLRQRGGGRHGGPSTRRGDRPEPLRPLAAVHRVAGRPGPSAGSGHPDGSAGVELLVPGQADRYHHLSRRGRRRDVCARHHRDSTDAA